ncbi:MAG: hypothetical protein EA397_07935 [Deltaproteobacteria bacterium]|nr:MAG: hypothetical protein EA397_07935 [Deltaproteobacteria bacterium]
MVRFLVVAAAGLFLAGSALAGPAFDFSKEHVKIVDNKMVIKELDRCQAIRSGKVIEVVHIKRYAEAPVNGPISRDHFVHFAGMLEAKLAQSMLDAAKKDEAFGPNVIVECGEVPVGTAEPEATLRTLFDEKGLRMQVEAKGEGQILNEFVSWEQLKQG